MGPDKGWNFAAQCKDEAAIPGLTTEGAFPKHSQWECSLPSLLLPDSKQVISFYSIPPKKGGKKTAA